VDSAAAKLGVTALSRVIMIITVTVNLKKIFTSMQNYPWPKPSTCPNCNSFRIWGHGFVLAYFDGFQTGIYIRRYRCPDCRCIIRMRPAGYLPRFQASTSTIRSSLQTKIEQGQWQRCLSRTRQRHWHLGLLRRTKAFLKDNWKAGLMRAFDYFVLSGINPVSRSVKTEMKSYSMHPTEG
jgi:hypothetical protein